MEMGKTLLNNQGLPRKFWADTINTFCYICNRCSVRFIIGKKTNKIYYGRNPNISHLNVFGLYLKY